ncbi:MAG: hypothetical protein Q8S33_18740 [Myxococcales bacterium]|nr:hypothetical protein [Myxococcales bacterium]
MLLHRIMSFSALQLSVLLPVTAWSQALFTEDFEGPSMGRLVSQQWTFHDAPGGSGELSGAAARRGTQGYRVIDQSTAPDRQVELGTSLPPLRANVFVRLFVRVDGLREGKLTNLVSMDGQPAGTNQAALRLIGDRLVANLKARGEELLVNLVGPAVVRQQWVLVEYLLTGAGTSSACVRFAVDGVQVGEACDVDLSGLLFGKLGIGVTYQAPPAPTPTGVVDFDDLAFGSSPVASRLVISADARQVQTSDCVPLRLELRGSFAEGPVASAFDELVTVDPAFAVFGDPACQQAALGVQLRAGQSSALGFVRGLRDGERPLGAKARSVVLDGEPVFTVSGAPTIGEPEPVRTGGCSSAPVSMALLGLASALVRRRRP